jgi:GDPmannose 4,6-dehydratase
MKGFWRGRGLNECFIYKGKKIIVINRKYFRPKEVSDLLGDFSKAKKILKWKPKIDIKQLISEMIDEEYKSLN